MEVRTYQFAWRFLSVKLAEKKTLALLNLVWGFSKTVHLSYWGSFAETNECSGNFLGRITKNCSQTALIYGPLSSTPPQFNTPVQHKRSTPFQPPESVSSTQKSRSSTHLSVQHQKTVSSIHKTLQINTPISSTHPSVRHSPQFNLKKNRQFNTITEGRVELKGMLNWRICWTEGCVELNGFWCWTDEFWVLKRCGPCVEVMC